MRISKMILNFALMASVTTVATTAAAVSSCNARFGGSKTQSTNPKERHGSTKTATDPQAGARKSHAGKK